MTLLRAGARTLLASQFVVSGFKAVKEPEPLVPAAEPLVERWLPVVQKYAPDQVAQIIPTDTRTLVRVNGALELVGGLALATGKGRRIGAVLLAVSLIPTTVAKYPFWTRELPQDKATDKALFLKNVSLLGGVVLAARDTEGKPGLAWLAQSSGQALVKDTTRAGRRVAKNTSQITDAAVTGGAALVGAAVTQSARARKKAAKRVKAARAAAAKAAKQKAKQDKVGTRQERVQAKLAAKQDKKGARQERVQAKLAAKQDRKNAAEAKLRAKQEKQLAKQARVAARQDKKNAKQAQILLVQDAKAAKKAAKAEKNLERGDN